MRGSVPRGGGARTLRSRAPRRFSASGAIYWPAAARERVRRGRPIAICAPAARAAPNPHPGPGPGAHEGVSCIRVPHSCNLGLHHFPVGPTLCLCAPAYAFCTCSRNAVQARTIRFCNTFSLPGSALRKCPNFRNELPPFTTPRLFMPLSIF